MTPKVYLIPSVNEILQSHDLTAEQVQALDAATKFLSEGRLGESPCSRGRDAKSPRT